jgi:short-subunit dehydrogenase
MRPKLKPLSEQTLVITGATSGHGLATALRAAKKGAQVVLVARDEDDLRKTRERIAADGGRAEYVVADVGVEDDVRRAAQETVSRFGGFDTWVNNAGVGIYGELLDTAIEDHRKVFETNYWGVVYGSLEAVRHFCSRPDGGALINVGSINGDISSPLLGAYNASKHAVKGFTNSLRIELIRAEAPVSVTLIKPSAIGTPFPRHGRNITGARARLPLPVYSPELVADAILFAAEHPRRSITVGGAGRLQIAASNLTPGLFDRIASLMVPQLIEKDKPVDFVDGSLWDPTDDDPAREGRQKGRRFSLYTAYKTNPGASAVVLAAGGLLLASWLLRKPGRAAAALALGGLAGRALEKRSDRLGRFGGELKDGLTDPAVFAAPARRRLHQVGLDA